MHSLYLILSILIVVHGCEIENDYDDDSAQCSLGCPDVDELNVLKNYNSQISRTGDCVYNFTCTATHFCCSHVAFILGDEVPIPPEAISNRSLGFFDDRLLTGLEESSNVDLFEFFGMTCIGGDWYGTKFPLGLEYMIEENRNYSFITPEELVGKKIKILLGSILC